MQIGKDYHWMAYRPIVAFIEFRQYEDYHTQGRNEQLKAAGLWLSMIFRRS